MVHLLVESTEVMMKMGYGTNNTLACSYPVKMNQSQVEQSGVVHSGVE